MDLKHPLRSLVPSLDWAVLEVLAATQSSLGVSQIGRVSSKGSRMGHVAVLERLVEHGLVIVEPANQGFLYRLNRDHMLAPAVLTAVGLRAQLLERLRDGAAKFVPTPVHASVFGSFARGEAGVDSDIDVLLLASSDADAERWDAQVDELEDQVRRWTGNRCRALVFSVERAQQLAELGDPIVANWIADGVLLTGNRLTDIVTDRTSTASDARRRRRIRARTNG